MYMIPFVILPSVSKPTIDSCRNGFYQGARINFVNATADVGTSAACTAHFKRVRTHALTMFMLKIRLCAKRSPDLEREEYNAAQSLGYTAGAGT